MESDSGEPIFMSHGTARDMAINPLDNPVWHALAGPHRRYAIHCGRAAHYPRDMAPFSAIAEPTEQAYADLGASLPPGTEARLFRPGEEPLPAGWEQVNCFPLLQMVAISAPHNAGVPIAELSEVDVPSMMELVAVATPGPFGRRTFMLGRYFGVREGGRLVAMAGQRLRLLGYVELSAICVHPKARGRGYAAALTCSLMQTAFADGQVPFLHVHPDNGAAVRLYEKLGFLTRRRLTILWRRPL
jgi:ribosomal protein S18 acetylase RimI-like enzyme